MKRLCFLFAQQVLEVDLLMGEPSGFMRRLAIGRIPHEFVRQCVSHVRERLGRRMKPEVRLDSAFSSNQSAL